MFLVVFSCDFLGPWYHLFWQFVVITFLPTGRFNWKLRMGSNFPWHLKKTSFLLRCCERYITFRTVLSFSSMLARGNLSNVGVAFAATGYYQQINRSKIKITEKWPDFVQTTLQWVFYVCNVVPRVLRQHWRGAFPVQCCLESLGQNCTRFLPMHCCFKIIKTTLYKTFPCAMLPGVCWATLHGFLLVQCCTIVLRQHWTKFFSVHNCLEPLEQHCTRFIPVQCCLKSIKTTLYMNVHVQCFLKPLKYCTGFLPV